MIDGDTALILIGAGAILAPAFDHSWQVGCLTLGILAFTSVALRLRARSAAKAKGRR